MRRRAILSYRGTCRRGDKRQIPTAGDAAPLKGKEEAVKEGQTQRRRDACTRGYLRAGESRRVVPRVDRRQTSLGIPAFRFCRTNFMVARVTSAAADTVVIPERITIEIVVISTGDAR